jgi:hypothetical protein
MRGSAGNVLTVADRAGACKGARSHLWHTTTGVYGEGGPMSCTQACEDEARGFWRAHIECRCGFESYKNIISTEQT